jgi:Rieske Fe-S protein
MTEEKIDRRKFIKNTCHTCGMVSLGMLFGSSLLESGCKTTASLSIFKTAAHENQVEIPISAFENTNFKLVRVQNYDYDIGLRKNNDNTYLALWLMCTHAGQALNKSGDGYYCTLHGSRFSKNGDVVKGPASRPLERLQTLVTAHSVIITLQEPVI